MSRVLVALAVLVSCAASADTEPKFARLRDTAERFDGSLSSFLEHYVGECGDASAAAECKKAAAAFRQKVNGKKYFIIIGEEQVNTLSAAGYSPSSGDFMLNLTPFFPAGNYALSQGAPHHADARGNPVFPYLTLKGKMPEGGMIQQIARVVSNRQVRLQLVFTPLDVWSLPKRGGGKMYGVKARMDGIVASFAGTAETMAAYYPSGK